MADAARRIGSNSHEPRRGQLNYNPHQLRVPAGHHDGGQWTDGKDRQLWKLRTAFASLAPSLPGPRPSIRSKAPGAVDVAAMPWPEKRGLIFGQKDLLEVGGGSAGSAPWLPLFKSLRLFKGKPTSGVLRAPGKADIPFVSGTGGPTYLMPKGSPGFNRVTKTHVEGHTAALMRILEINRGTLYINNPTICKSCTKLLDRMLPPGASLKVVRPDGTSKTFTGRTLR
jgi:hypothetical protein